jgi:LmbE family N-acetylglucosaminyl deacetylase
MKKRLTRKLFWKWMGRAALALILVLLALVLEESTRRAPQPTTVDLQPISLDGVSHILVLAPHCDDETLGPGGLMLAARRAGIEVRVVIATNGDGYLFATMQDFKKIYPHAADFVHMGEVRQQESLAALSLLGVVQENVYFLSYPDRGTPSLWSTNWSAINPFKSPYNGSDKSPYPITYNSNSVYAGENYLADLTSIIEAYHPDLVIYPHPDDVHPDHWGLNVFTRLALTEISHNDPTYQPRQLTYLVHRPDYPVVRGNKPTASLVPPPPLYAIYKDWYRWDLTAADVMGKASAVEQYKSQLPSLRGLMESFVRQNELFAPVSSASLATAVSGNALDPSTWQDVTGKPIAAVQLDPTGDVFSHKAVPATDLVAVYAARTSADMLLICMQTSENAVEDIRYSLRLKSLTEQRILSYMARTEPASGEIAATRSGLYVCAQVALADLQNPWAIFLGAEAESPDRLVPFDQTAWQMIYLQH